MTRTWERIDDCLPGDLVLHGGERTPVQILALEKHGDEVWVTFSDCAWASCRMPAWVPVRLIEREVPEREQYSGGLYEVQ